VFFSSKIESLPVQTIIAVTDRRVQQQDHHEDVSGVLVKIESHEDVSGVLVKIESMVKL
jgi:hypothetical protein